MSHRRARLLREAQSRREARDVVDFSKLSFGPQRAFIEDDSLFVAACTGRRAGKTDGVALKILRTALRRPRCYIPYITLSRPSGKRIMWPKLKEWDRKLGLGARWNGTDLTMTLQNDSIIQIGGANDEAEIDRYRGVETPLVVIDEAQSFRSFLETLIEDVLEPTGWGIGGQIVMTGTPNSSGIGYFARATNPDHKQFLMGEDGPAWSSHHWTALDNPHMEDVRARWGKKMARLRVDESHPKIQREHWGRWVKDQSGLVYKIPDHALIPEMPEGQWDWYLGGDYGNVDKTTLVLLARDDRQRLTVVAASYSIDNPIPSRVIAELSRLESDFAFVDEVFDPGGGGKGVIEELNQLHGGRIRPADKTRKDIYIELLNSDLRAGRLQIVEPTNEELLEEASVFSYDNGRTLAGAQAMRKGKRKLDDRLPDDFLDGMLYGWRAAAKPAPWDDELEDHEPGTPGYFEALEEDLFEKALRRQEREDDDRYEADIDLLDLYG